MTTEERPLADMLKLDGKVAVITGAAQGIGLATARRLGQAGAQVVLADIDERVHDEAKTLETEGYDVSSAIIDVTQDSDHARVAQETVDKHGSLDVWVNNAGIYPAILALDVTAEEWRRIMAVNLDGTFFGTRAAARQMIPNGSGVVLNIVSTSGFRVSNDGMAGYASSKSGVRGIIQALAREFGPHGIRVLGLAPTLTMTQTVLDNQLTVAKTQDPNMTEEQFVERYTSKIPLRRVATADDMALVAAFCVSDLAGYVTGSVIPVDGGMLAV